jgi:hypothetical protein
MAHNIGRHISRNEKIFAANEGDEEQLNRVIGEYVEALQQGPSAEKKSIQTTTRDKNSVITALFKVHETRTFLATMYTCEGMFRFTPQMSKGWVKANVHKTFGGVRSHDSSMSQAMNLQSTIDYC